MSSAIRELDVRTIPPPRRHPEIFGVFDALKADEAFILINDHYPKPLLYQFQMERPRSFEWSVLEAGPDRYRVEIRRRADDAPRRVTEYLEGDHQRLDAIIPEVRSAVAAGAFGAATERFAVFVCGLDRHIRLEEQILFPFFEQMTGTTGGPPGIMRQEHVTIRRYMDDVTRALEAADGAACEESLGGLVQTLAVHNMKEERVLYPMIDEAVGTDQARDDLVKRLQVF